ncbi:MAG: class I SAM-dependent methyltransferase [Erysipelotrichaceae bacterium]|jgi:16S rRNA (guanine1207-N2)-methyltransferase
MSYYFTNDSNKTINRKKISFRFSGVLRTFISDDGVFSKSTLDFGSRVLLETLLKENINGRVVDMGCGLGYIGILLKEYKPEISLTMADVNETAVALAKENSLLYHQNNEVFCSDGFDNIEGIFDVIVTNPPIRTGKKVIYKVFADGYQHLKEKGIMYLVIKRKQGAESAVRYLQSINFLVEIINKESGYWVIKASKKS